MCVRRLLASRASWSSGGVLGCLAVLTGLLAGCSESVTPGSAERPESPVQTISMLPPLPEEPPSGALLVQMRQSSLDAAAGQVQVWVDNDTLDDLEPTRIGYSDPRLPHTLLATRLRSMPAQAERGFPLALPARPRCAARAPAGSGTVVLRTTDGASYSAPVSDETDVIGRYVSARCGELRLRRVVDLAWADRVDGGTSADGATGRRVLVLQPTGATGRVVIESIGGSHLLGSARGGPWTPGLVVRGTDGPSRVSLPLRSARCDAHAFMEGGNATAFRVGTSPTVVPGACRYG